MHYPISILALARKPIEVEMGLGWMIYGGTMAWQKGECDGLE